MFSIPTLTILIPALPLAATLATAVLGPRVLRSRSHVPVITALGLAFVASVLLLRNVAQESGNAESAERRGYEKIVTLWTWAAVPRAYETAPHDQPETAGARSRDFRVAIALRADPLSAVMLVVVTLVSLAVAIYSVGYMHGDPGYWRFFTYIGLFVFSMTMLVSASNFVLLYVFWEAVGLCSYLLIGFWYQKPAAAAAGKKAFLVNRVGDFGFALGVFLIGITYGTLDFHDTPSGARFHRAAGVEDGHVENVPHSFGVLGQARVAQPGYFVGGTVGTAICLLLLLGACGKSAQLPLHVWLPDAMEGPTPVSALIHAATMVTAGIYMVARCAPLFAVSPDAQQVIAVIGGLTALVGAFIALSQYDLKRILAYSTISQLGYMFLGLGAGTASGINAGMFHLVTHAFFKSLLFLGAGAVMHAMGGVIDIRRLAGLWHRMPLVCWTFLIGCLALSGVFPFAGFWSKDAILAAVHERASEGTAPVLYLALYWMALATAGLTAFYAFRAFFLVFLGPERVPSEAGEHVEKTSPWMALPLVFLALASVEVGAHLDLTGSLESFLARAPSIAILEATAESVPVAGAGHFAIGALGTVAAALGIGLAWLMYVAAPGFRRRVVGILEATGLYRLSAEKLYFDHVYQVLIVWPLDGVARLAAWFDRGVIDGLVDLVGAVPRGVGALLRPTQAGLISLYALGMFLGVLLLLGTLLAF